MCGSGSVVERCLAKANVASSNLVSRSKMTILRVRDFLRYALTSQDAESFSANNCEYPLQNDNNGAIAKW